MSMEDIKSLINKYLEGETSEAEEDFLRRFFTEKEASIPEEWRVYRALFTFETHERAGLTARETENKTIATRHEIRMLHRTAMRWIWAASAAASVAILVAISLRSVKNMPENYVVADGKIVTTNKASVTDEAEEALRLVSAGNDEDFNALKMMMM